MLNDKAKGTMPEGETELKDHPNWHFTCRTIAGDLTFHYAPSDALDARINDWVGDTIADVIRRALEEHPSIDPEAAIEFLLDDLDPNITKFRSYTKDYVWTHIVAKLHEAMGSLLKEALLQATQEAPVNGKMRQLQPSQIKKLLLGMNELQKERLRMPKRGRPETITKERLLAAVRDSKGDAFPKAIAAQLNVDVSAVRKAAKRYGIELKEE